MFATTVALNGCYHCSQTEQLHHHKQIGLLMATTVLEGGNLTSQYIFVKFSEFSANLEGLSSLQKNLFSVYVALICRCRYTWMGADYSIRYTENNDTGQTFLLLRHGLYSYARMSKRFRLRQLINLREYKKVLEHLEIEMNAY